MKILNNAELKVVNGGDLTCPKTQTSVAAAIVTGTGALLSALGNSMHVLAPNLEDPNQPKYQRNVGVIFAITGYVLEVASMALSTISAAQSDCVTKPTTDPTIPNP